MTYSDIVGQFLSPPLLEVHECTEIARYMLVSLGVKMASPGDYVCDFQYNHCISCTTDKDI